MIDPQLRADTDAMHERMREDTIALPHVYTEEGFLEEADDDRDYGVDYIDPAEAHMFNADDVGPDDGSRFRSQLSDPNFRDRWESGGMIDADDY